MWGRASASSRSPSAVNRLLINLQTNTDAESQTSPGNRTGECGVLPTRGGLARCLLAPGRPSAAPLRRSSRSGPTCRRGRDGRELALRRGVSGGKNKAAGPPEYPEFVVFLQRFCQALPTSRCDVVGRQAGTATPESRLCDAHTDCETETDG